MADEDVPEMYRGSQKQIDGYRFVRALTSETRTVPEPSTTARPVAHRPTPTTGTIYFAGPADGPIKIGFASRLKFRLNDLRLANAFPLELLASVEGPPILEREYHKQFKDHRLHGEWFAPHPDILAEIERLSTHPVTNAGRGL